MTVFAHRLKLLNRNLFIMASDEVWATGSQLPTNISYLPQRGHMATSHLASGVGEHFCLLIYLTRGGGGGWSDMGEGG